MMSEEKRGFRGFRRWGRKKRRLEKEKERLRSEKEINEKDKYKDIDSGQVFLLSTDEANESSNKEKGSKNDSNDEVKKYLSGEIQSDIEDLSERNEINSGRDDEKDDVVQEIKIKHENKEENKEERSILKPKKNRYLFRVIWIVFLTFISVLLAGYALVAMNDMLGIGESDNIITVDLPKDANLDTVSGILKDNGVIRQEFFFKMYAIITKNSKGFLEGTHELKPNMDYQVILNNIKSRAVNKDVVEVAFREGMNLQEYADLLSENGVCGRDEFLEKCKSDEFDSKYEFLGEIKNKDQRYYKLEGYLFPDTYEFYKSEDPSSVIRRFLNNFQKKIIKVNSHDGYDKKTSIKHLCEEAGKTLDEVINIASMVQAEAADKSDMYKVASVIYNRLDTLSSDGRNKFGEYGFSKLSIDSTVWYPYKTRGVVPNEIVEDFHGTYDTYEITGLPPGAICNPGIQAIYATLNPEKTEFYYFCHSSSGDAYYAKTNSVHMDNLRKAGLV